MKFLITVLLFFSVVLSNAQPLITYIDRGGKECPEHLSQYKREVTIEGNLYHVREYNINQKLYMDAYCTSLDPVEFKGVCTYYYENGQKRMETKFVGNQSTGWKYWTERGEEATMELAFKNIMSDSTISKIKDVKENKFKEATFFSDEGIDFDEYLLSELKYPYTIAWRRIYDKLKLGFVIDTSGKIRNVVFVNKMGAEFEGQIRRALVTSSWKSATYDGKKIKIYATYTVNFNLSEEQPPKEY